MPPSGHCVSPEDIYGVSAGSRLPVALNNKKTDTMKIIDGTHFLLPLVCTAAALVVACSNPKKCMPEYGEAISFMTDDLVDADSKVTPDGTWESGDYVAVKIGSEVKKYQVTSFSGPSAVIEGSSPEESHYWQGAGSVNASAWYAGGNYLTDIDTFEAAGDQSNVSGFCKADLLYAPSTTCTFGVTNSVKFYHQMAKIRINIVNDGILKDKSSSTITVTIGDVNNYICMNGRFSPSEIDIAGGKLSGLKGADDLPVGYIRPRQVTTSTGCISSYEALVVPQDLTGKKFIAVKYDGEYYYYIPESTSPHKEVAGGYLKVFNVKVNKRGLEITSSNISGWTNKTGGSGIANEI